MSEPERARLRGLRLRLSTSQRAICLTVGLLSLLAPRSAKGQDVANVVFIGTGGVSLSLGAGARAFGMGGAFIGIADDATASSWNPAGLAVLERPEASLVWKIRQTDISDFSPRTTVHESRDFSLVFRDSAPVYRLQGGGFDFASVTYPLKVRRLKLVPQLSLQSAFDRGFEQTPVKPFVRLVRLTPASSQAESPAQDQTFTMSQAVHSQGGFDVWALSLAGTVDERLFFGISVNNWNQRTAGTLTAEDSLGVCATATPRTVASCEYTASKTSVGFRSAGDGVNFNLGILVRPSKRIRVGVVFKTPFNMRTEGEETSTTDTSGRKAVGTGEPVFFMSSTTRATETGVVRWPKTFGAGIAFSPRDPLTMAADVTTTSWSHTLYEATLQQESFRSGVNPDGTLIQEKSDTTRTRRLLWPTLLDPHGSPPGADRRRNQVNSFQTAGGVEYVLIRKRIVIPVRAGAFLDQRYFTDGRGRRVYFWGWSLGAGVTLSGVSLEAAYVWRNGSFSTDYLEEVGFADGGREQQISRQDDRFTSHRVYLSSVVRF